jgi:transcription elongation factor Elf1
MARRSPTPRKRPPEPEPKFECDECYHEALASECIHGTDEEDGTYYKTVSCPECGEEVARAAERRHPETRNEERGRGT